MLNNTEHIFEKYITAAEKIGWEFARRSQIKDKVVVIHDICGEEQEVWVSNLFAGMIKCRHCQLQSYAKAAQDNGWGWVGMEDHTYSRYRHSCGHEQRIQMASMAKQKPVCEQCQHNTLSKEACDAGWVFVRKIDKNYGEYVHESCGTTRKLQPNHVRKGHTHCEYCSTREKQESAQKIGLEFIRAIGGSKGEYKHTCGNSCIFQFSHVRKGSVKCKHCYETALKLNTEGTGWTWLKRSGNSKSLYEHKCGHHQVIKHHIFNESQPICRVCESSWYDKESSIYVLLFTNKFGNAVKVGFAKSQQQRQVTFKLQDGVSYHVITTIHLASGREAIVKEKNIHKLLRGRKLPNQLGKTYISSGFTEMYPENMLNEILDLVKTECRA